MTIRVAIISQDDVWSGSICLLMDFLHAAGKINALDISTGQALFECHFVSVSDHQDPTVHCFNGLQLKPGSTPQSIKDQLTAGLNTDTLYDAIILPAVWGAHTNTQQHNSELIQWLQAHHNNGAIISGLVTGPFLMAAAGLLDFKQATVHWSFAEQFRFHFPEVNLTTDQAITQADNCWCTADINASLEIGIRLLAHFYGDKVANQSRRYFLTNPFYDSSFTQPNGSSARLDSSLQTANNPDGKTTPTTIKKPNFPAELTLPQANSQLVKAAFEIIQQDFQTELGLPLLAQRLNVTTRTLNRHFSRDISMSPLEVLTITRLRQACRLLADTDLPINLIAYKSGFQTVNSFSRVFKKIMQKSARQWRNDDGLHSE
ncbi:GlxA family transcriptional regulator [Bacterioplanoides sp.]|uniref:GlxA family transcriptional regulator n=1 Tax=Bacterioplanoides sp. TaxID=2066072 RepID=UPI003B5A456B